VLNTPADRTQAALTGYTAVRRYVLENQRHHKRAEMLVRMTCLRDGSKQFDTISATGWGGAQKHVFPRLLEAETEASQPGLRERSRIIPANYVFEMVGSELLDGRPVYVVAVTPKTPNKYLMQGRIWIDADEYAIVRIEGKPAKNPSFWTKSVHFIHNYEKRGSFWFPVSDHSVTDVRIFGTTAVLLNTSITRRTRPRFRLIVNPSGRASRDRRLVSENRRARHRTLRP
jgi:hypothetical protein